MGEMHDWYVLIRAAKYLGVAPWELAEKPIAWMNWALAAEDIDDSLEREMAKRARGK